MILTADKGVALVVLNTEDYLKKAEDLLKQNTYRVLTSDPTMRLKNKMINLLKSIKSKGGITEELYRRLYPTGAGSPKFYGLPKIHKPGMPLRPIVQHWGCHLPYIKRSGQDPQAPGGKVCTPCQKHPGFHRKHKGHPPE